MASLNTILYASQNNGGKSGVSINDIAGLVGGANAPAATTTTPGVVLKAADVANCTVAADGTSAGTQLNALLASLKAAGILA